MRPVENQKVIWNKGYDEVSVEDMYRNGIKFDFICNGDRKMIHVCIQEEKGNHCEYFHKTLSNGKKYKDFLRIIKL